MREPAPDPILQARLRQAYADPAAPCPPPERFLEAALGELEAAEAGRLDAHAEGCPACAAERELARAFAAAPEEGVEAEDVDYVVARLERGSPLAPAPPAAPLPFRSVPRRRPPAALWRLAAAAVLVLAVGVVIQRQEGGAPDLPPRPAAVQVRRGATVELLAPEGELGRMPGELRWEELEGAAGYRVILFDVDNEILWKNVVPASPAALPEEVAARLHPAVVYLWKVEALDETGALLATSEPARFRARP